MVKVAPGPEWPRNGPGPGAAGASRRRGAGRDGHQAGHLTEGGVKVNTALLNARALDAFITFRHPLTIMHEVSLLSDGSR